MEEIMAFDLNQEPWEPRHDDSEVGLGSLWNDIDTAHGRIEERIQQLEALTDRAMQRRRQRQGQNSLQPANEDDVGGLLVAANSEENMNIASEDRTAWDSSSCNNRGDSHLIAKALEIDVKKAESGGGGIFDCNICLDIPREPIVTCCGHMFCWPCFFRIPCNQSGVRECPVCRGEVAHKSIIPVYGGSETSCKTEAEEAGLKVPPRPQARRVETRRRYLRVGAVEPQLITLGEFLRRAGTNRVEDVGMEPQIITIDDSLLLAGTNRVEDVGEQTRSRELDSAQITSERTNFMDSQVPASQIPRDAESSRRLRALQFSRLLSQEAASLSSLSSTISSALNSVENMVGDLEAIIHSRGIRRNLAEAPPIAAIINSEGHTFDTTVGINTAGPSRTWEERIREQLDVLVGPPYMRTNHPQAPLVDNRNPMMMVSGEQTSNVASHFNSTVPLPSSSSRSTDLPSTNLQLENETTDTAIENSFTLPTSLLSTRRSDVLNILDVDNGLSREARRRRLG